MKMALLFLPFIALPYVAMAISRDVAISEVFFDPTGTDTGSEYVVIKNLGSEAMNLSGWNIYLDDAGYYTFSSFSLMSGGSATMHIRKSGANSKTDLYFSDASASLRNFSGSLALFSNSAHSTSSIIAYVRYHKPGSVEHKTWESLAASADIWTKGDYVNVGSGAEGKILKLADPFKKLSSAGWVFVNAPQMLPKIINATSTKTTKTESFSKAPDKLKYRQEEGPSFFSQYFWLLIGAGVGIAAGTIAIAIRRLMK